MGQSTSVFHSAGSGVSLGSVQYTSQGAPTGFRFWSPIQASSAS